MFLKSCIISSLASDIRSLACFPKSSPSQGPGHGAVEGTSFCLPLACSVCLPLSQEDRERSPGGSGKRIPSAGGKHTGPGQGDSRSRTLSLPLSRPLKQSHCVLGHGGPLQFTQHCSPGPGLAPAPVTYKLTDSREPIEQKNAGPSSWEITVAVGSAGGSPFSTRSLTSEDISVTAFDFLFDFRTC